MSRARDIAGISQRGPALPAESSEIDQPEAKDANHGAPRRWRHRRAYCVDSGSVLFLDSTFRRTAMVRLRIVELLVLSYDADRFLPRIRLRHRTR